MTSMNSNSHIDAVITWVDGKDELHQKKLFPFLEDKKVVETKSFRTKLDQHEEIKYTVNSILKYASFIRNIYIVTDEQVPLFLKNKKEDEYLNVHIVDHFTIFKGDKDFLPVFNCRPIETKLYAIPNLSEHFVYFNDDMFLLKHVKESDFFLKGKPVIRGKWIRFADNIWYKRLFNSEAKKKKATHKKAQEKSAKILGFKKYFRFHHAPYPLRKSTFENFFKDHKGIEELNIEHKFRNVQQYTPQGLANHIEIRNKTCVLKNDYQLIHFRSYKKPLSWIKFKLNTLTKRKDKLFLNLQSLDQCPDHKRKFILAWLDQKYIK